MIEPYYEELEVSTDKISYPFDCFISDSLGEKFNISHHWHYYIELLYFLEGNAQIFLGGEYYNASCGDFVLINSREVHSITSEKGINTKYIVIKFDPEVLYTTSKTVFEAKYIMPFTMAQHKHQKVFRNDELVKTQIEELFKNIYEECLNKKYGFELAVRTGIGRIFLWVIRNWESKGVKVEIQSITKEIDVKKLQQVVDYIDKHYAEEISAEEMSKLCSMSYSYFSRFFKKVMRKTFSEYLNYVRIIEAEKLLLTTDMNITEIALSAGFSNSSYFIKQFRLCKKISPKQFKKII